MNANRTAANPSLLVPLLSGSSWPQRYSAAFMVLGAELVILATLATTTPPPAALLDAARIFLGV